MSTKIDDPKNPFSPNYVAQLTSERPHEVKRRRSAARGRKRAAKEGIGWGTGYVGKLSKGKEPDRSKNGRA